MLVGCSFSSQTTTGIDSTDQDIAITLANYYSTQLKFPNVSPKLTMITSSTAQFKTSLKLTLPVLTTTTEKSSLLLLLDSWCELIRRHLQKFV